MTRRSAFTLVEVLTVIAIIGILVTITTYVYSAALIRSRDKQRLTDLQTIQNGLEQYYLDYRTYPPVIDTSDLTVRFQLETGCAGKQCLAPKYLTTTPVDPKYPSPSNYVYLPLANAGASFVGGYYLGALVEVKGNASTSSPASVLAAYDYTKAHGYGLLNLCTQANWPVSSCTQNYYLKNSRGN
ncbi:MAG TPA: type II secretion system protein [Candidatus Saccharimonadales bacterium]|nr:type II secretion system protein [Candidatus Saccharimonadales bacterium]